MPQTCVNGAWQDGDACPHGCEAGVCVADPCDGITCTLPEPECLDGGTRRVYTASACVGGTCEEMHTDQVCSEGCQDGACNALVGASRLAVGFQFTCLLTDGGGVKCWGGNILGALGNGENTYESVVPVDVVGLESGVSTIESGTGHTCAVTSGGGVKCWGWNSEGQVGNGVCANGVSTPVDVIGLTSGVSAVTADGAHTCALMVGGGAKCWGDNHWGELGTSNAVSHDTDRRELAPVDVLGLDVGVSVVSTGSTVSCALSAGGVKCWGNNDAGQLGDGSNDSSATPVDVVGLGSNVLALSTASSHSCALTGSGGVKCRGSNSRGQLGNNHSYGNSNVPVNVVGLASGVVAVSSASSYSCAVTSGGGVKCWGANGYRQLGDGSTQSSAIPVDVVGLDSGVTAVATASDHACALTIGGGVKCWGDNGDGQLGDGTLEDSSVPVDVVGL
jgi:alpha-tubulin suppressor-like RCC1 family protein